MKHTFKKNNEVILYEQIITKKLLRKNLGTSLDSPKKKWDLNMKHNWFVRKTKVIFFCNDKKTLPLEMKLLIPPPLYNSIKSEDLSGVTTISTFRRTNAHNSAGNLKQTRGIM